MSAARLAPVLALAVALQFYAVSADFSIAPFLGKACKDVNVCGKGKCVESSNSTFGFECQCDPGWKQTRSNDDSYFKFQPCVFPNCTMQNTCASNTASPPPNQIANSSFFDPCFWAPCEGGSCNKSSLFSRTCSCNTGYFNLLNSTTFPCFQQCEFGIECSQLNIGVTNPSNATPTTPPDSHGTNLIPRANCSWLIVVLTTLALSGIMYNS